MSLKWEQYPLLPRASVSVVSYLFPPGPVVLGCCNGEEKRGQKKKVFSALLKAIQTEIILHRYLI